MGVVSPSGPAALDAVRRPWRGGVRLPWFAGMLVAMRTLACLGTAGRGTGRMLHRIGILAPFASPLFAARSAVDPSVFDALSRELRPAAFAAAARAVSAYDVAAWAGIECPVRAVSGADDVFVGAGTRKCSAGSSRIIGTTSSRERGTSRRSSGPRSWSTRFSPSARAGRIAARRAGPPASWRRANPGAVARSDRFFARNAADRHPLEAMTGEVDRCRRGPRVVPSGRTPYVPEVIVVISLLALVVVLIVIAAVVAATLVVTVRDDRGAVAEVRDYDTRRPTL
ncbi:hypothetical protein RYJ27_04170 [Microbacterium limosum]|uniref:Uncharacterized protein n=1 Tax=Microbacterium limosum TaxID=3079935 RepID=A0AAU0MJR3_9MICO|nr:hypothetical protein [Microbacterium sp. Y20]WOQ70411.1 hypothetical protein RYJ27_04170 [Microbacterium sp. Y20]